MKRRWTWLATAALFLIQPAAEAWAQTTTNPPSATACPNCPNGGVPKRDGTGMKKQRGQKNAQKMGNGQHKGMHRGMQQQQQQGPGAGGGFGRGGGGGMMRGGGMRGGRS